jgi:Ca2+-binding EF-hand superfamily protein
MIHKFLFGMALVAIGTTSLLGQNAGPAFDPTQAWAQLQQQLLQRFDQNKDGKLTGPEQLAAQEYLARQGANIGMPPGGFPGADQFNKQFDRNGDGKLDPMEKAAAAAAYNRMRKGGGKGGGGVQTGVQTGGVPGPPYDPAASSEQKESKVPPLIKRFDKDGDGKLNAAEKAAAQAEFKKSKTKDGKDKDAKDKDSKEGKEAKGAKDKDDKPGKG